MGAPIAYAMIGLGSTLLRVAPKFLDKYVKAGAKHIKNPTKEQIAKSRKAKPFGEIRRSKKIKKEPKKTKSELEQLKRDEKQLEVELEEDKSRYIPRYGQMDKLFQKGGKVKKNYTYGGRVAKYKG